ncbi:MAG: UvrD-helicase domain-containing protein [Treponema sp.]|nr:UvrD-helicase domain-containing protein [Treponema sp.]MEE3435906.1 UvrD-helicase domain-containing protein [Treponema sp.]
MPATPELQKYLSLLNPEQKQAVEHEGSPLLILAGAGSGKTRVITTKIAWLISEKNVNPRSILAVTFTKKAANEMRERAQAMEPGAEESQIRTFHSFGAYFLRRYAEAAGVDKNFTVYDDDDMVTLIQKSTPGLKKSEAASYAHSIALAKDYCLPPDSLRLGEVSSDPLFPEVYAAYQKRLRSTGNVDFGDLIMLPVQVLAENANIARQMHYRYRVIMVDEYQDSNVAQFLFLKALSGVDQDSGTYVCVVGDDDQSIYKFRGAEVQNILNFQKEFPGTQLIRLERNYRSTSAILNAANCVIKNNSDRLGKTLSAERGDGKKPDLIFLPNQDDEAAFCAELIKKQVKKGGAYSDWAILYRTNAQSLVFESEFLHKRIPYQVVGTLKFYEREEIKDLLAFLALLANPKDEIAFRRIVNKPARGLGPTSQDKIIDAAKSKSQDLITASKELAPSLSKKAREGLEKFSALVDSFKEKLGDSTAAENDSGEAGDFGAPTVPAAKTASASQNLGTLVEEIMQKSGLEEYHQADDEISGTQRVANMQELANNASLYPLNMDGLLEFLDSIELDRTLASQEEQSLDRVTLITLHNTKGLEFKRVIITGLEQGIFPRADKSGPELEEERRLFYVGITRAQDELYITSCAARRMYGRTEFMQPSVFLQEAGADTFRLLGNVPPSFERAINGGFLGGADFGDEGDYGAGEYSDGDFYDDTPQFDQQGRRASSNFGSQGFGTSAAQKIKHPLAKKYGLGQAVYHDDYGYGQIAKASVKDGEYVIEVQFQNGGTKKFLPAYQAAQLMCVEE